MWYILQSFFFDLVLLIELRQKNRSKVLRLGYWKNKQLTHQVSAQKFKHTTSFDPLGYKVEQSWCLWILFAKNFDQIFLLLNK